MLCDSRPTCHWGRVHAFKTLWHSAWGWCNHQACQSLQQCSCSRPWCLTWTMLASFFTANTVQSRMHSVWVTLQSPHAECRQSLTYETTPIEGAIVRLSQPLQSQTMIAARLPQRQHSQWPCGHLLLCHSLCSGYATPTQIQQCLSKPPAPTKVILHWSFQPLRIHQKVFDVAWCFSRWQSTSRALTAAM